jgi:hypothetical protein
MFLPGIFCTRSLTQKPSRSNCSTSQLRTLIFGPALGASLTRSAFRPFSISNPEDRVFFMERTFMFLVRATRLF